jgi:hypothetical protein
MDIDGMGEGVLASAQNPDGPLKRFFYGIADVLRSLQSEYGFVDPSVTVRYFNSEEILMGICVSRPKARNPGCLKKGVEPSKTGHKTIIT